MFTGKYATGARDTDCWDTRRFLRGEKSRRRRRTRAMTQDPPQTLRSDRKEARRETENLVMKEEDWERVVSQKPRGGANGKLG